MNTRITVKQSGPVLRATVPLPAGHRWNPNGCPFALVSPQGKTLRAQWERVFDHERDGVRIAEVLALTPEAETGTYQLVAGRSADNFAIPQPMARAWFGGAAPRFELHHANGDVEVIQAEWASRTATDGQVLPLYERNGPVAMTRRFYCRHFVGWATIYHGLDVVEVDLIFHNGHPNSPHLFFKELRLLGLDNFNACQFVSAWPDPTLQSSTSNYITLVGRRADGKCWIFPQRYTRHWRFVIHSGSTDAASDASALAFGGGFGAADSWTSQYAWIPMNLPLPDLAGHPVHGPRMVAECQSQWAANKTALVNGTTIGGGVKPGAPGGRLGIFNVWGADYGGVTGGTDRELAHTLGICGALTAEPSAYLALQSEFAMTAYRTPIVLVESNGAPCRTIDWLDASGKPRGNWSVSAVDGRFALQNKQSGAFGFYPLSIPTLPATEYDAAEWDRFSTADGDGLAPHDWQHFVRAWSPAVALVLLRNDMIAKWTLQSWSEVWWMACLTDGKMAGEAALLKQYPNHGTTWGRAHGHGWAMAAATYAISGTPWRSQWVDRLMAFSDTMDIAQMSNGLRRAIPGFIKMGPMFVDANNQPLHAATTPDEEVYLELAWRGANNALSYPFDATIVHNSTARLVSDGFWDFAWGKVGYSGALPDWVAVRPVPRSATPYTTCPVHNNGDNAEVALVLAFVLFDGTADTRAREMIAKIAGSSSNPLASLLARNWTNLAIDDTAFLIAALQRNL